LNINKKGAISLKNDKKNPNFGAFLYTHSHQPMAFKPCNGKFYTFELSH